MVPTGAEAVVEEGTLGGKSAPAIHGEILAKLWMSFTATFDPWAIRAIPPELAMAVLMELAHHGQYVRPVRLTVLGSCTGTRT